MRTLLVVLVGFALVGGAAARPSGPGAVSGAYSVSGSTLTVTFKLVSGTASSIVIGVKNANPTGCKSVGYTVSPTPNAGSTYLDIMGAFAAGAQKTMTCTVDKKPSAVTAQAFEGQAAGPLEALVEKALATIGADLKIGCTHAGREVTITVENTVSGTTSLRAALTINLEGFPAPGFLHKTRVDAIAISREGLTVDWVGDFHVTPLQGLESASVAFIDHSKYAGEASFKARVGPGSGQDKLADNHCTKSFRFP